MPNSEIESLRNDIREFTAEIKGEVAKFREDMQEVKLALAARSEDKERIGELKVKVESLEAKVAAVEKEQAVGNTKLAIFLGLSGMLGSTLTAALMKWLVH